MHTLRIFSIVAWVALPTVMFGGYALLGLLNSEALSAFQLTYFRAGHAHAGVLLLMALLYHHYMEQTSLRPEVQRLAAAGVLVGILAQSGGFFLHMVIGRPGEPSAGTALTITGAVILTLAVLFLVYGLVTARPGVDKK